MKQFLTILFSFSILAASAQTVDDVIQKYSANLGGLDAFNKIKTAKMTGNMVTAGTTITYTSSIVNNKAVRVDMEANGSEFVQVYNDGKGWKINPFQGATTPTEVTGGELNEYKLQSSLVNNLMDYKNRGHKVELLGQENVDGIKCYKIKLIAKEDSKETTYYINTADYYLVKSVTMRTLQGADYEVETFFSDFKDVKGLKFAMVRSSKVNGEVFQTATMESIELDVPIDEKIFKM